ncbi:MULTISPECIES: hypothetical protein [Klebsiella]|uniref:hypothetical protein n=1 Tax=Klebsiella pneumoniae complex TaxID=3390273 RepID=UPI000C1E3E79|nr:MULTISPECIES: hypothetical protein [Klebsiella]HCB0533723.1 hypothetical protein [Klebsiella variicola subsp. variicola]HCC2746005.1 hypothetical protein [Klebsiella quasipneumoniae]AXS17584.1 hypothetical protein D0887_03160 [Klebsiella pneumoniae]EIV9610915.1 hypothetical protein [Klebsiella pneumoniae]ELA1739354.1 hypothetical protein [Klebsiella pneumoniae]
MRTIIFSATVSFCFFLLPFTASAVVFGGSNLGFTGYPDFSESEPLPPYDNSDLSKNSYRIQVESYVRSAQEYLDNANSDIKRIQESKNETAEKANRVIESYNNYAKGY